MRTLTATLGLALLTVMPTLAQTPSLTVESGSDIFSVPLVSEGNDVWGLNSNVSEVLANGSSFTIMAADTYLDSDPKVQYGLGVTNDDSSPDGSFTPYTFTFTTPTTLTAGLYSVSSTLAGSLTDGGSNGSTLKPTSAFPYVQQSVIGTADAGVDLLNSAVSEPSANGVSQGFTVPGASGNYTLTSTVNQISIQDNFQVSDNDTATLSGRFNVAAAPEPRSIGLGVLGVVLFAVLMVRRSRSA